MSEFGKQLRDRRKAKGMTIKALAEAIGCSAVYVSEVERGTRPPFQRARVEAACKALGLFAHTARSLLVTAARDRVNDDDAETLTDWAFLQGMDSALGEVRVAESLEAAVTTIEAEMNELKRAS
jgi:transcriptional regulator with XRE-family HTH domain